MSTSSEIADDVERLWRAGLTRSQIARRLTLESGRNVTQNMVLGLSTRLNLHHAARPNRVRGLAEDHPAVVAGTTLFVGRVRDAAGATLLKFGNQAKLGRIVAKGAWRGMPIYSLTLEERATCPRDCHNWGTCYGNTSHRATRYRHGPELERRLEVELADLQRLFPAGFVVRLHQLGDFYSVKYVEFWGRWLDQFPALRVFGYTARNPNTPIGRAIRVLSTSRWDRFSVRLSARSPGPARAVTIWTDVVPDGVIACPAQTGKTKCCASCALCWSPAAWPLTIGFFAHGR